MVPERASCFFSLVAKLAKPAKFFVLAAIALWLTCIPSAHALRPPPSVQPLVPSSDIQTSPAETHAGGCVVLLVGRHLLDGSWTLAIATGCEECGYKTASGLASWLNGDPLREGGGVNLYGFNRNNALNRVDPWGLDNLHPSDIEGTQENVVNTAASEPLTGGLTKDLTTYDGFIVTRETSELLWEKRMEEARFFNSSGVINDATGDLFLIMLTPGLVRFGDDVVAGVSRVAKPKLAPPTTLAPVIVSKPVVSPGIITIPSKAPQTFELLSVSRATPAPTLGETALKGISDDMMVHFSSIGNRASILENGLVNPGNGISFFRVGDVKHLTASQVRGAIGWGAQSGLDNSLAVIVSPNSAQFTRGILTLPEYITFESRIPWTLVREVPGGRIKP